MQKHKRISVTRLSKRISEQNGTGIRAEHKKPNRAAVLRGNTEHESFDREVRYFFSDESVKRRENIRVQMRLVLLFCASVALGLFLYF